VRRETDARNDRSLNGVHRWKIVGCRLAGDIGIPRGIDRYAAADINAVATQVGGYASAVPDGFRRATNTFDPHPTGLASMQAAVTPGPITGKSNEFVVPEI
jgi:hypothetical protein